MDFEVEAILDDRINGGITEYFVKWRGFPEDESTWEPEENLNSCGKLLQSYKRRCNLRKRTKDAPSHDGGDSAAGTGINASAKNDDATPGKASDGSPQEDRVGVAAPKGKEKAVKTGRGRGKSTKKGGTPKKQAIIKFNFSEREVPPKILEAVKCDDEVFFVVKWEGDEGSEMIPASEMYVEYPLYVFSYYESLMEWVDLSGPTGSM